MVNLPKLIIIGAAGSLLGCSVPSNPTEVSSKTQAQTGNTGAYLATIPTPIPLTPGQLTERGLGGWNILGSDYVQPNPLDGISIEWDYYMIHDDNGKFSGIVANTLIDPRQRLSGNKFHFGTMDYDVMPSGLNMAVVGIFANGQTTSEFINVPPKQTTVSATDRTAMATAADGSYASETPVAGATPTDDRMVLKGKTPKFAYDLTIAPDWLDIINMGLQGGAPFASRTSTDIGVLPGDGEHWTVRMIWPRTRVQGTITNLATKEVINISGHGYRENSWGRWLFALSGWDFGIFSDQKSQVQWAWQSYHTSKTLDSLDVAFVDKDTRQFARFLVTDNQLGWSHKQWHYDAKAMGCVPDATHLVGKNKDYTITADITINNRQTPILSNVTFLTKIYFIQEQFPYMNGSIKRNSDGSVVTNFSGIMGGEFSLLRSLPIDPLCLGPRLRFQQPLPK